MAKKAPGKHHRQGIPLMEIFRMFPDNATAEDWFTRKRWPEGAHCPHCGSTNIQHNIKHKTMTHRCREKECARRFSVRTGTPMQASNLGFQVWAIALYLITTNLKGVSSMKLHRDLDITQKTAWHLAHRIRELWKTDNVCFKGPIEVDESYWGGAEKNKHASKKMRHSGGTVAAQWARSRSLGYGIGRPAR